MRKVDLKLETLWRSGCRKNGTPLFHLSGHHTFCSPILAIWQRTSSILRFPSILRMFHRQFHFPFLSFVSFVLCSFFLFLPFIHSIFILVSSNPLSFIPSSYYIYLFISFLSAMRFPPSFLLLLPPYLLRAFHLFHLSFFFSSLLLYISFISVYPLLFRFSPSSRLS
jgi:hypothetical protein